MLSSDLFASFSGIRLNASHIRASIRRQCRRQINSIFAVENIRFWNAETWTKLHFVSDIFRYIFVNENDWISIQISPTFVSNGLQWPILLRKLTGDYLNTHGISMGVSLIAGWLPYSKRGQRVSTGPGIGFTSKATNAIHLCVCFTRSQGVGRWGK